MGALNRFERQTLRAIQAHMRETMQRKQVVIEHIGTVDVFFHPTNPDPHLNCVTPHKGVAWIRREDLTTAFAGLERLGRIPRLVFLDALFPMAFQQQLEHMGLTLEHRRVVMGYRPLYGPNLPDENPLGQLPQWFDEPVSTIIATSDDEIATWLRVFRSAYYNTESITIELHEIRPLVTAVEQGENLFVVGSYENTPLGAARVAIIPPTAEIQAVATAPLWHGMGLEPALITTAVYTALDQGCDTIFCFISPTDLMQTYRRLGFIELANWLTLWRLEDDRNQSP
ncbi:MAG: GNAT family N-acetyltransferase [Anaerolineae bacterium]|nr:GNAT family N-acetyltransferase [Anaerolineae bacterium]